MNSLAPEEWSSRTAGRSVVAAAKGMPVKHKMTVLGLSMFGLLLSGAAAHAITINVTTFEDELNNDGDCSLREAVVAVNTAAARDACPGSSSDTVIRLQAGRYNVTGRQLLRRSVSIEGAGMEKTILDWRLAEGGIVANKAADGDPAVVLGLKRVRLEGVRRSSGAGGCLSVVLSATLNVEDSAIVNCRAESGGGIHNSGVTSIKRSLLDSNHASERGGGIDSGGTMTIEQSTLRRNRALTGTGRGGGIYGSGTLTLTNSTLSQNKSLWGGGLFSAKRATLRNVTVAFNEAENGGGLHHFPSPNTSLVLSHTIVAKNTTAALVWYRRTVTAR